MRSLALPCVLLIACISGSCGQSDLLVFFKVTGQTASIKSLGITLRLDGKLSKEGDFVITESLDRFAVQLPPSAAGLLTATVSGRDGVGAVIAGDTSARAEIAADARSVELEVSLHALHSCSTDGWCPYSSPLLTAPTDLKAIWSHDHADVWVGGVSKAGSMLHWNGQYWSQHELNTPASILSIWGSDSDDIYAANTDGPMLHWDGNSWRPVQSTTTMNMSTIWGSGPNDIWSASTTKDIVHGDGSTWQRVTSDTGLSTVNGIWGSDAEHVWIVVSNQDETKGGVLFCTQSANHCDDFTASMVPSPKGLTGIWGSDDNDIWAIAQDGFWHYDGKWTFTQADPGVRPLHISGSDSADIWAVGENMTSHWDGKIWQHVPIEGSLLNVAVSRKRDVWAVGRLGLILHRKDNRWYRTPENYVTPSLFTNIRRLWGPAANNIWAVGSHALLHWNGFSWSSFSDISISLNSIRGIDADHIWAVGDAGIIMSWQKDRWLVDTSLSI